VPNYATLGDCSDPVVRVAQEHLDQADTYVDSLLAGRSIDLDAATPTDTGWRLLRDLAVAYASYVAAVDGAAQDGSVLWKKADVYKTRFLNLAHLVSWESLGIVDATSGHGFAVLGRS